MSLNLKLLLTIDKNFESTRCLICLDAPCTAACERGNDPARGIRALRFENNYCVGMFLNNNMCADCDAPCEKATDKLDRYTYVLPRIDSSKCIGCGRCYVSCFDGGHQAISFDKETRMPRIIGKNCVGCHLCMLVCPVDAMLPTNRIPVKKYCRTINQNTET